MNSLAFQIHYNTFSAFALASRLFGREPPLPTTKAGPSTYAEARTRIQRVLDVLGICEQEQVNAVGETMTTYPRRAGEVEVPVKVVAAQVIMPNVYFHTAMAYAVLRKEGVPLGKRHWSRGFVGEYL